MQRPKPKKEENPVGQNATPQTNKGLNFGREALRDVDEREMPVFFLNTCSQLYLNVYI